MINAPPSVPVATQIEPLPHAGLQVIPPVPPEAPPVPPEAPPPPLPPPPSFKPEVELHPAPIASAATKRREMIRMPLEAASPGPARSLYRAWTSPGRSSKT